MNSKHINHSTVVLQANIQERHSVENTDSTSDDSESSFAVPKTLGRGCGKFILAVVGIFLLMGVCWGGNWLWGRKKAQMASFPMATVMTQQVDNKLIVSLPQNELQIEMVFVPAGEFPMGSEDEDPVHNVYLDAFWIDQTEVTNAQFSAFIKATGYETTAERSGSSRVRGIGVDVNGADWKHPQGHDSSIDALAEHPVVQVSWYDAAAYCQWRGARLPTEAEWEKAARGTDSRLYPWGNQFDGTRLNFCDMNCSEEWQITTIDDKYARTSPVGSYPNGASPYNAMDMAGNVSEWVADWYAYDYYTYSPATNPQGPADKDIPKPNLLNHMIGGAKVTRGGTWAGSDVAVRADRRNMSSPDRPKDDSGFRCAYTP